MIDRRTLRLVAILLALAGIAGIGYGGMSWRDASVISQLRSQGQEAVARIESGRRTNWKGVADYAVNLSWTDKSGAKRQAKGIPITEDYAKQVVRGGQFVALAVPIRYSLAETKRPPVIVPDAERLESALVARGDFWFWIGLIFAVLGLALYVGAPRLAGKA